ncbi:MAG: hypothetical protein P8M53_04445 [Pirellulales bacterium]|nr:hypothetical protein [Pirellulales bacterium]
MTAYQAAADERNFGEDATFLAAHQQTIVLGERAGGPRVAIVPAYQGRVMTSSAKGDGGTSYGWINYDLIETGEVQPQIHVFGGEERCWLGPEGGQFSIFFDRGATFDFSQWRTPPVIDTEPFAVVQKSGRRAAFRHEAELTNYSGTRFAFRIERDVELLDSEAIRSALELGDVPLTAVAYRTTNCLTNIGKEDWSKSSGLLSIWMLGMYKHGPETTVVIPFNKGGESALGKIVNDDYFGKVPAERLSIGDGILFFAADGQFRSKIGLNPQRSTPLCGSYDAAREVLTVVQYNQPAAKVTDYVNSKWELQKQPYAGDVINAYNDGPAEPGAEPLGPFYELETSSPALPLASGASGTHIQTTFHFEGDLKQLDAIARKTLGVSLAEIEAGLKADK